MDIDIYEAEQKQLPPIDLEAEIKSLQEELIDERDRNLRTLADFKNYRNRIKREGNKIAEESIREMILALLDIIDDMEKALQSANNAKQSAIEGLRIIHKKFLDLLETYGVFPFESVGMQFDHNFHDAVAMAKQKGSEPEIIVDELRRGYLQYDELLRPAQVRVSG